MEKLLNYGHIAISAVGGFLAYWLGGYDLLLQTVAFLTLFDLITGVAQSIYNNTFDSGVMRRGIFHKIFIYLTIAVSVIMQHFLGDVLPIRETVITFYIVMEGMSVVENIGKAVEYPEALKKIFVQLQDHAKSAEDELVQGVASEVQKHE